MPRLLEKSVLLEETLAKPFPPVTMGSESIKAARPQVPPPGPRPSSARSPVPSRSPGLLSYPAVTAANVGLPFWPGSEAAFVSLCLLPFECFVLESLEGRSKERTAQSSWAMPPTEARQAQVPGPAREPGTALGCPQGLARPQEMLCGLKLCSLRGRGGRGRNVGER